MFTGLIEDLGTVVALSPLSRNSGLRLRLRAGLLDEPMPLGASLAVNGVCLTVVTARAGEVEVELGPETLSRTTLGSLAVGDHVHLERALRLGDRLGGHLVSGHVDGIGTIQKSARRGDSWDVTVLPPPALARYLIEKGAITIDGISLTVNTVEPQSGGFSVSLVPYTQTRVTLSGKPVGARVNLEVDLIGKYVERLLAPHLAQIAPSAGAAAGLSALTLDKLKENGFV